MLRYGRHQQNYQSSLQHGINAVHSFKRSQFETISEDFPTKWSSVLYDAERKLVNLLLHETRVMHKKLENEVLKISYPHNHTDMKNVIMRCNITLKITSSERRKKEVAKA